MRLPMHVDPSWLPEIWHILDEHAPGIPVFVFGSRAHGQRLKRFSDLDLCLRSDRPVPARTVAQLLGAFSESNLPIKVDVVDWRDLPEYFRKEITKDLVALPRQGIGTSQNFLK